MELKNYLTSCRYPRVIKNKRGKEICVSCGYCPDCANRKSVHYTNMLINESKSSRYSYFVTLSYDEFNVPRMRLLPNEDGTISCIDVTSRKLKNGSYKRFSTFGKVIHKINTSIDDKLFKEFYKRADIESKQVFKKPFKNLRYCSSVDVQRFFKRVRFYLCEKVLNDATSQIRYFATTEYGPDTFRPHVHILFFFDDYRVLSALREVCLKSWKFGNIVTEIPESTDGVCSYVASYLNSVVTLPSYLCGDFVKPRTFHSLGLGSRLSEDIRDYVYSFETYPFDGVDLPTRYGNTSFMFTASNKNRLFPKCYNYESQPYQSMVYLYRYYEKFKDNGKNVVNCTYDVIFQPEKHKDFLKLLDISIENNIKLPHPRNINHIHLWLQPTKFFDYLRCKEYGYDYDLDDYDIKVFNRIYSALLLSKNFLKFNCAHLHPLDMINKIRDFYLQFEFHNLSNQYIAQDEYLTQYPTAPISVFYPLTYGYRESHNKNELVKIFQKEKDLRYSQKIKHKEQNDRNKIFCQ